MLRACHWVASLFRRLAVEMLGVCLGVRAGMVDDPITMIRRRVEGIQLQRGVTGIDDVVSRPRRYDDRETCSNRCPDAVKDGVAGSFLYTEELVELVDFRSDFFLGLQHYDDQLAVLGRIKHLAKIGIADRETLDVLHKAFHMRSFRYPDARAPGFCSGPHIRRTFEETLTPRIRAVCTFEHQSSERGASR